MTFKGWKWDTLLAVVNREDYPELNGNVKAIAVYVDEQKLIVTTLAMIRKDSALTLVCPHCRKRPIVILDKHFPYSYHACYCGECKK